MSLWCLASAGLLAGALVAGWVCFAGSRRLHAALRRVAAGEYGEPISPGLPRWFRAAGNDLRLIAARLGELDRAAGEERTELEAILGSLTEGIFIAGHDLRIRTANCRAAEMFGRAGDLAGRTVLEASGNHEVHRIVKDCIAAGRPARGEIAFAGGLTVELGATPLALEGACPGAVVVAHDISRIRSLERVRREFVANVSHELRTPLTILNGYIETLRESGFADPELAENSLRVMAKHTERLKRLADDLLAIAQAESRAVPLDLRRVDLPDLLHRVASQCAQPGDAGAAAVAVTAGPGDLAVEADERKLEHVFINLLDNALQHATGPDLAIRIRVDRAGDVVRASVADNGPGIPLADQEHIFERFYRVHKHRSRDTGGTGLGLSIVKNIVQAHGGAVSVESSPGHGAVFHVDLPVRQGA